MIEHRVRVTTVLVEDGEILLVAQRMDDGRVWSLPGGRVEYGESLRSACKRETLEETGFVVEVGDLLYVAERIELNPQLLHITFECVIYGGERRLPTNEHDENPISDVRFVPISELSLYGFSDRFCELVGSGFPDRGSYVGAKSNIGDIAKCCGLGVGWLGGVP